MFADACQKAMKYTRPVAVSTRTYDGQLNTDVGAMIVLNEEGWVITAGHIFDSFVKFQTDIKKMEEIKSINASRVQNPHSPSNEIKMDKSLITNHSFWWGWDGVRINNVVVNRQVDIAIGRLENFNSDWIEEYPVFADPEHMRLGTIVCRGGYPFISIKPEFIEDKKAFRIPSIPHDRCFYPIEGIYSHYESKGKSADGSCIMNYIETSSPGLKGQSGGPIFDRDGRIYGMQVMTEHRPMGFHPAAELDGQKYIENQFMNIGVGIHVSTIFELLNSRNIRYQMEGDESGFRIIG
ncbi:MAG: trypsin-like peptidase domain-containing protein [Thermoplasmata archaeon]|nr:trypsin-like peptidase domain-containing protein [Thermoplasmata archaeon]